MELKFDPYAFESTRINSVPVHLKHIPWANDYVEFRATMKVGARHDPDGKEGLAHFFEHLPFDGCRGYPNLQAMEKAEDEIFSGDLNANTDQDRTCFEARIPLDRLESGLAFLGELVASPILDKNEIERERGVIISEIWRRFKQEKYAKLARRIRRNVFGEHVLGRTVRAFGWDETVRTITHEDILNFHRQFYHRQQLELVLVGNIAPSEIYRLIEEQFVERIPPSGTITPVATHITSWPCPSESEIRLSMSEFLGLDEPPKQTEIVVGRIVTNNKRHALGLSGSVVRQLAYDQIRGQLGATYAVQINQEVFAEMQLASLTLQVAPTQADQAKEIILQALQDVVSGQSEARDLFARKQQNQLDNLAMWDGTVNGIADSAVSDLVEERHVVTLSEACRKTAAVTYADIQELVQTEFAPDQLQWFIAEP